MKNTVIVLGGDGYYGWPISLKLAVTRPDTKILIVDNEWRRNTVCQIGSDSLTPVARLPRRVAAFREMYGQDNLHYLHLDVNSDALEELIRTEQPHTIYHMAQQCSAPYSMLGLTESLYTINNNEGNNMRLLWAVRKHVPDCHIIKMGSMGEYATGGGIDIAEGYFYPEFNGKKAVNPLPFPRQSDDVYHISKINDSNYIGMAARKWGLRITEVMQSTLFGVYIDEMQACEDLYTRFDYDDIFGTVVNRFLTQAVAGHPLTVYGKGNQTTGIMPMKDAVNSLELIAGEVPERGVHKVVNHVTLANNSINELAESVREIAAAQGFDVVIDHVFDPRSESAAVKHDIKVMADHVDNNVNVTAIRDVLQETFGIILKHQDRIRTYAFTHHIHAFQGQYEEATPEQKAEVVTNEQHWRTFRAQQFGIDRINLNPGTLGTPSARVKQVRRDMALTGTLDGNPLGMYEQGRKCLAEIRSLCNELWPSDGYRISVGGGASQMTNLLALSLIRSFHAGGQSGRVRVLTSRQEHPGGIGVFEQLPEFEVHYVSEEVLENELALAEAFRNVQPQVAFLSHVFYASGKFAPVESWTRTARTVSPGCRVILDVTQSVGLYELPFGEADALVGSLHKWLFGPHGSGLLWLKEDFADWIGGIFWNGLESDPVQGRYTMQGGQDFLMYAEILEALKLYLETGKEVVRQRSAYLTGILRDKLERLFSRHNIPCKVLNTTADTPILSVAFQGYHPFDLYSELNQKGVHTKCIISYRKQQGEEQHVLRFGVPYYETADRLSHAITVMEGILQEQSKVIRLDLRTQTTEVLPKPGSGMSVAA